MNLSILKESSLRKKERKKVPINERLLSKIDKNDETNCWEWTGSLSKFGYGRIGFRDKVYLTHRISYEIFNGSFDQNLFVCHKCDNPKCINPEHLFLGSQLDNMKDCSTKKRAFSRSFPGEDNPFAKLSNKDASLIRCKLKKGYKGKELAKLYNVNATTISNIKNNKTYTNSIGV